MDAIAEKTHKIIADTLGHEEASITPETDFYKDLNTDSLDMVELVMILEKEFGISIPDEKVEHMKKVRHFTEYFEKTKPMREVYYSELKAA